MLKILYTCLLIALVGISFNPSANSKGKAVEKPDPYPTWAALRVCTTHWVGAYNHEYMACYTYPWGGTSSPKVEVYQHPKKGEL